MNLNVMVFTQEIIYLKDRSYVINLDEYGSIGNHWIVLELTIFQKKLKNS